MQTQTLQDYWCQRPYLCQSSKAVFTIGHFDIRQWSRFDEWPFRQKAILVLRKSSRFRVHIVAQWATRYIVAFHIVIPYDIYLLTYSLSEVQPIDKQCRLAIIISTTVICRLKYPEQTAATDSCHAVYHTQITRASIPCHNDRLAVAVSFEVPDSAHPDNHLHRWSPQRSSVGGRPRRLARRL